MIPPRRELTFLGGEEDIYDKAAAGGIQIPQTVGFAIISTGFFIVSALTYRLALRTRELYEWNAIRLIMPTVLVFLGLESATFAVNYAGVKIWKEWTVALYMFESTCAPGIFLSTFITTFLAYRTRSIPFCLVYRGQGRPNNQNNNNNDGVLHTDDEEERRETALIRPATMVVLIRLFSLSILVLSFVVNFDVVWEEPDLAGRTGWVTVISKAADDDDDNNNNNNLMNDHLVYSLLPMGLVGLSCIYFSFLLWQYGSYYSMTLYPTACNPWIYTSFGTLCLIGGQFPGPDLFPILSNAGILIYMISLLALLYEVRNDLRQASDLGHFLSAVGIDHVTNTSSVLAGSTVGGGSYKGGTDALTEEGGSRGGIRPDWGV